MTTAAPLIRPTDAEIEVMDRSCAAALMVSGVRLVRTSIVGGWTSYWFSNRHREATKALMEWRDGILYVPARQYSLTLRELAGKPVRSGGR